MVFITNDQVTFMPTDLLLTGDREVLPLTLYHYINYILSTTMRASLSPIAFHIIHPIMICMNELYG